MLDAAQRVREITEGHARDDFQTDNMPGLALVRLLEIVGEAARGVSPELRARSADVPWHRIVATRNRIVHAYFDVDIDIVWQIATEELPPLVERLQQILAVDE
jgi:uncharacterized protein with HEPN domain